MTNRIPSDAFEYYVAFGPERSYQAVADHFGVAKRSITRHAKAERWAERLERIEREARERADQRLVEHFEDMRVRHLKTLRAMNARALSALKDYPLTSGMEAMRAAEMVIKLERLIAGEPTERSELSVEEVTRREVRTLLVPVEDDEEEDDDADEDAA